MTSFIRKLIEEGEHQLLDFKFEISDSRKIARTMVAFANTDGGRLLIGVKDNGMIAGVRSEEEFYMAEGAARLHCRPEVPVRMKEWEVEGKKVLEIIIAASKSRPHLAQDPEGRWVAYFRQGDQNFVANSVMTEVWRKQREPAGILIRYREEEKQLLEYLEVHERVTLGRFQRLAAIGRDRAEAVLVNFILLGMVTMRYEGEKVYYYIRKGEVMNIC